MAGYKGMDPSLPTPEFRGVTVDHLTDEEIANGLRLAEMARGTDPRYATAGEVYEAVRTLLPRALAEVRRLRTFAQDAGGAIRLHLTQLQAERDAAIARAEALEREKSEAHAKFDAKLAAAGVSSLSEVLAQRDAAIARAERSLAESNVRGARIVEMAERLRKAEAALRAFAEYHGSDADHHRDECPGSCIEDLVADALKGPP